MTLANAHALFNGLRQDPSFLASLTIDDDERARLVNAQREIRRTLKEAASQLVARDDYWQDSYASRVSWRNRPNVQIKFMTQGSFAYGTLNVPAQAPAQEIDLDDGIYIPVTFLDNGEPALAAKGLFEFIEGVLDPLCTLRGWKLDRRKEHCVRVKLWPGAHIDLPIYSIPDERFAEISEKLEKSAFSTFSHDSVAKIAKLPSDQIMLALRGGNWMKSDPQQLHDWVTERVQRYGPVYRRLCRFFKGWRDFIWTKPGLSSICLMVAIDEALRRLDGFPTENRDDEVIMEVARHLPEILQGKVQNPVLLDLCLNEWSNEVHADIVMQAQALRDGMVSALEQTGDAELVVRKLRDRFGGRIPYRPDCVKIASKIDAIVKAPPATVAAPLIIPSTSG